MGVICDYFIKKQKEALIAFLKAISKNMNEYYLYMNKSEMIDEIEFVPIGEGDELDGITIQYKFHGKVVSPPEKYMSESHLNCLGISLFLSSVKTFNKNNGYFVLDDVIASFDKPHRIGFARLLLESFNDYQIFLFTHEQDWFEILASMVKPHDWVIKKVLWTNENGTEIEIALPELKDRIEYKLKKRDASDLGNMIRKYLEGLLKEICFNLEVKLRFLFDGQNENRMSNEMLSELIHKLKDRKCELKDNTAILRINELVVIGNKSSHDSTYTEDINDLEVFYNDVLHFELVFRCAECKRCISIRYFDSVNNLIRCSCENIKYNWQ